MAKASKAKKAAAAPAKATAKPYLDVMMLPKRKVTKEKLRHAMELKAEAKVMETDAKGMKDTAEMAIRGCMANFQCDRLRIPGFQKVSLANGCNSSFTEANIMAAMLANGISAKKATKIAGEAVRKKYYDYINMTVDKHPS